MLEIAIILFGCLFVWILVGIDLGLLPKRKTKKAIRRSEI